MTQRQRRKTIQDSADRKHELAPIDPAAPATPLQRFIGPALIAAVSCAMLGWTWGTWPDVQVDFGREAYIAWRLADGEALYRDIAYYNGPLSPYLNSVWFRTFGVSLRTLELCNLAILVALIWLLYTLLTRISDRLTATIACLVFVLLFAFSQYVMVANYNYMCPYSHDAVHGVVLSLAAVLTLTKWSSGHASRWAALTGILLGLAFLTRSEVFLAGLVGVAAGVICLISGGAKRRSLLRCGLIAIGCALIPPASAYALLALAMPAQMALTGTLGTWPATLTSDVASLRFFRAGAGLLDVPGSLRDIAAWSAWYAVALCPAVLLAFLLPRVWRGRALVAIGMFIAVAAPIAIYWHRVYLQKSPFGMFKPLPLLTLAFCWMAIRSRELREQPERGAAAVALGVFAMALLGKMILNARIINYGFYLAMPATLLAVVLLVGWIPAAIARRGGASALARAAALGSVTGVTLTMLLITRYCLENKRATVGRGPDRLVSDFRGEAFHVALQEIEKRVGPNETLVAFPEGVMLNFLSRRRNSTRHTNFMPTEMVLFGEDRILAELRSHPPDWALLVHKDTSEFGYRFFGHHYAKKIGDWLSQNYQPVRGIGAMPLQGDEFGILMLRRTASAGGASPTTSKS